MLGLTGLYFGNFVVIIIRDGCGLGFVVVVP